MGNIKSIIHSDRVVIFNPSKPVVELWTKELAYHIPKFPPDSWTSSFELSVLEEMLREMCDMYDRRLRLLTPLANNLLVKTKDEYDAFEGVQKLVPVQDGMNAFELEVKEARQCLLDILGNSEDLRALLLSDSVRVQPEESEDAAELLLESYTARLSHLLLRISLVKQRMASRANMAKMSMIIQRNRIMRMNLHTSVGAIPLAACSVIAGMFGMNLHSGLEDTPDLFGKVFGGTLLVGVLLHAAMVYTIFGRDLRRKHAREAGHLEVMKHMLTDMKDIDHAVKLAFRYMDEKVDASNVGGNVAIIDGPPKSRRLSKDAFRQLLRDAKSGSSEKVVVGRDRDGKKIVEDVDVFFDLIDANGDGFIDNKEMG